MRLFLDVGLALVFVVLGMGGLVVGCLALSRALTTVHWPFKETPTEPEPKLTGTR